MPLSMYIQILDMLLHFETIKSVIKSTGSNSDSRPIVALFAPETTEVVVDEVSETRSQLHGQHILAARFYGGRFV